MTAELHLPVIGVDEARRRLPEILNGFARHTREEPVAVGAYRRPQGVIISTEEYEEYHELKRQRDDAERARAAAASLASIRAEGLEPTADAQADVDAYIAGVVTADELVRRAIARHRD